MHKSSRQDLHHRKNADVEHYFFYQVIVFQERGRAADQRVLEEKPGDDAGYQVEDKGNLQVAGARPEADRKDKPVNQDGDDRLDKSPDNTQIRPGIPGLKIVPG